MPLGGPTGRKVSSFPTFCDTTHAAEYVRGNLRWSLRESSSLHPNLLPLHFVALCPEFDHTLKLRWDIVEAWLLSIEERLRDTQVPCLVKMVYNPQPHLKVTSRLRDVPLPSSDKDGDIPEGLADPQVEGAIRTKNGKNQVNSRIRSPDELLAEGTQGNPCSARSSLKPGAQVASTITSSTLGGTSSSTSDRSLRHSSSERASTSSSLHEGPSTSGKSVLKRKGRSLVGLVPEIVVEGPEFPRAPARSDPQDGPGSHFPNPKVVPTLKRTALEKQYLVPAGYTFVIPEVDATVNESPAKCIAFYRAALNHGLRFPLQPVIEEILNKYEMAPAQVMPTSWHNICSFIMICDLRGLTCTACAFSLTHTVQKVPKETGHLGWYCFNNRPSFLMAIEKKSKVKY
ncbi:hypothetical protein Cgig2_000352 [Carnegiea gigantea]|uniref:Uncharacterized protein n=1 Tax=Carnegiea gigantea TaxID=171969 RepID=A0A9Q1QGW8_9CARY|nr:hypothetical protein Cgig2_000352 [Carnegiea gigantea]